MHVLLLLHTSLANDKEVNAIILTVRSYNVWTLDATLHIHQFR